MAIKNLNPYLKFNGTAQQAIKLYETALGARIQNVMRFGDAPAGVAAPEHRDRVMHATLDIGGHLVMLSDTMPSAPASTEGSNVHIVLNFDDADEMARKFEALSVGGQVTMPLQDTFWGAKFGMLTDAFGIRWMFNHEQKKNAS